MNQKELETFNNLVNSNNSFCNALKENKLIKINIYLQIELVLIYFRINYHYLSKLSINNQQIVFDLLDANNFFIEEDNIIYRGTKYSIDFFKKIINEIEEIKYFSRQKKIIQFNPQPNKSISAKPGQSKIIDITFLHHNSFFDMKDRARIFEECLEITSETTPYIEENKMNFKDLLNNLIITLLNSKSIECDYKYLLVLAAYLCLYPIISYSKNKFTILFDKAKLPKEKIGLRKYGYHDDYLDELSLEIKELNEKRNRLILNRSALPTSLQNYESKVERINEHIYAIERKQLDCYYNQYAYKNLDEIYNPFLLESLFKSFEQCNVSIDEMFQNPVIRFFYINKGNVKFYCAMRLNTLLELSDYGCMIPPLENITSLKLTI